MVEDVKGILILSDNFREDLSGGGDTQTSPEQVTVKAFQEDGTKIACALMHRMYTKIPGIGRRMLCLKHVEEGSGDRGARQGAECERLWSPWQGAKILF